MGDDEYDDDDDTTTLNNNIGADDDDVSGPVAGSTSYPMMSEGSNGGATPASSSALMFSPITASAAAPPPASSFQTVDEINTADQALLDHAEKEEEVDSRELNITTGRRPVEQTAEDVASPSTEAHETPSGSQQPSTSKKKKKSQSKTPVKTPITSILTSASHVDGGQAVKIDSRKLTLANTGTSSKPLERSKALKKAVELLLHEVPALPIRSADIIVNRFGEVKGDNSLMSKFSTVSAIHPVGFSCSRFEFSPVHGRVIKMRCDIFEGYSESYANVDSEDCESPVFAISWGKGVDDETTPLLHSFDPYFKDGPEPESVLEGEDMYKPEPKVGLCVKVKFSRDWYKGKISNVIKAPEKSGGSWEIEIVYEDGGIEKAIYPDKDIILFPSTQPAIVQDLSELEGITTVTGNTPLEAWGNVLLTMGLVDEETITAAYESLEVSREKGLSEAQEKVKAVQLQRRLARERYQKRQRGEEVESHTSSRKRARSDATIGSENDSVMEEIDDLNEKEELTAEEEELKEELQALIEEYDSIRCNSCSLGNQIAAEQLNQIGPFLSNPFKDSTQQQQAQWLSSVVRKEKSKMGSTGNKRKIVSATDLLEKTDTFFNKDIETLVEGLPGVERCPAYTLRACRGGSGVGRTWVYETLVKNKKDLAKEKKSAAEAKVRAADDRKKEEKRAQRERALASKKQQLVEIEEEKKKERREERLERLRVQVEDRLGKEVAFQRDKVVQLMIKSLMREYSRRKRAAEVYAQHIVEKGMVSGDSGHKGSSVVRAFAESLPPNFQKCDRDVVRLWDYFNSYSEAFDSESLPSFDSFQNAINIIRLKDDGKSLDLRLKKKEALKILEVMAISACKHLGCPLLKLLSNASVINAQQKELLPEQEFFMPVNQFTWREITRLLLISECLIDIGNSKLDTANVIRGYRAGGHHNSKEAQRVRRGDDYACALAKQSLKEHSHLFKRGDDDDRGVEGKVPIPDLTVRVNVPCIPSCVEGDWCFYLHNVRGCSGGDINSLKNNIQLALDKLKVADDFQSRDTLVGELNRCMDLIDEKNGSKARTYALRALDRSISKGTKPLFLSPKDTETEKKPNIYLMERRIVDAKSFNISKDEYSKLVLDKEEYMATAVRKTEMERRRQQAVLNDEDEEDDEDDEDDEQDSDSKAETSSQVTSKTATSTIDEEKLKAEHEYFCSDEPSAPEPIRRCLLILKTICNGPGEPFVRPVDPQENPRYYDVVLRPMCLEDVGVYLKNECKKGTSVEKIITQFARYIRLIVENCICFSPVGAAIVSSGEDMLNCFERLLFEWVLVPNPPAFDALDDEKCIPSHPSDSANNILICDRCEGKYNMKRLRKPLNKVPQGDWYCINCLNCRSWATDDPRIGLKVQKSFNGKSFEGLVKEVVFAIDSTSSLRYVIEYNEEDSELWKLSDVDENLKQQGKAVEPIKFEEAIAESAGYGIGTNFRMREVLPSTLNPTVSETAAQFALSSSVFRDHIACIAALCEETENLTAEEWLKLLSLLTMKCTSLDLIQSLASQKENEAAEANAVEISKLGSCVDIYELIPKVSDDDDSVNSISSESSVAVAEAVPVATSDMEVDVAEDEDAVIAEAVEVHNEGELSMTQVEAVEVVSEDVQQVDSAPSPNEEIKDDADPALKERKLLLNERNTRNKKREEVFIAAAIKDEMRPVSSTFAKDTLSTAVDEALPVSDEGLSLRSTIMNDTVCQFCGMSDVALGAPLIRVPSKKEWTELLPHAVAKRRVNLIASIPDSKVTGKNKIVGVTVRVNEELVSVPADFQHGDFSEGGMLEFVPRNSEGFQRELIFRDKAGFPFICGKLSAHACCAIGAHISRLEELTQKYKENGATSAELDHARMCGRTLPIGKDGFNRIYWAFKGDPSSLFVCTEDSSSNTDWYRYSSPESIASIIAFLRKDHVGVELARLYPDAAKLLRHRRWADLLLKQKFDVKLNMMETDEDQLVEESKTKAFGTDSDALETSSLPDDISQIETREPFEIGENVLVESKAANRLWDAVITDVSSYADTQHVNGYRVRYVGWNSRFDEWVRPARVVESSEYNIEVQEELREEMISLKERNGVPIEVGHFKAFEYVNSKKRARGNLPPTSINNIIKKVKSTASLDEKALYAFKCLLLIIETALPIGALDMSSRGTWREENGACWRQMVGQATGASELMKCVIILEDAIRVGSLNSKAQYLLLCLPKPWKAVADASVSSIALRLYLLDNAINYGATDASSKRKSRER